MRSVLLWLLAGALQESPADLSERARTAVRSFLEARLRDDAEGETRRGAEIEELATRAGDSPWHALLTRVMNWSQAELSSYDELSDRIEAACGAPPAAEALAEIRTASEETGADVLLARELGALGHALGVAGRDDEGCAFVAWLGARCEHYGDLELLSWSLDWRGQNRWRRGELAPAAELLAGAAEVDEQRAAPVDRTRHLADVARLCSIRGDLDGALEWAARAESAARASSSPVARRIAAAVRAGLLFDIDRPADALALCLESAPAEARDLPQDEAQVRLDLLSADVLADVGRLESAALFARRAHEVALSAPVRQAAPLLYLEAKLSLGLLLGDLGACDEGLTLLDAAAVEFARLEDPRGAAWAQKNRGFTLFAARRYPEAVLAFEQAEQGGRELAVPFLEGIAALGLAETLVLGAPVPAEIERERVERELAVAARAATQHSERQIQWRVAALRGRMRLELGEPEAALEELSRAVEAIERWRRRLAAPGLIEHALRARSDPYRDAALAAAELGRTDEALHFAQLLQGRVLHDLRARRSGPLVELPESLVPLRERIGRLRFRVTQAAESGALGPSDELDRAEAELDAALLAGELAARDSLGASRAPSSPEELRLALVRARLDVALSFLVGPQRTLAFAVDARAGAPAVTLHELDVGRACLARLVERLRDPIARLEAGELDLANLDFDSAAARELYDLVVRPLDLAPGASLAIVADEALAALPFELLVSGGELEPFDPEQLFAQYSRLSFLGDEHAVAYYGSLADLARPVGLPGAGEVTLFVAPESIGVAEAPREVANIERALRDRPVRVVSNARPEDVEHTGQESAIRHFIAHGCVDAAAPAHGYLLLGGASGSGAEHLEAWQIERLGFSGALVVLSACHSGQGTWLAGAGLAGLTRAFLLAGAREVVASSWAVEDRASARFMGAFYRSLGRELTVPEALRAARLELRRGTDGEGPALHPYSWAAWIVQR